MALPRRGRYAQPSMRSLQGEPLPTVDPLGLAIKARSDAQYDAEANRINSETMTGDGGFGKTLDLMNNSQSKASQWAPFFQALSEQGVDRVQGGHGPDDSNQLAGFGSGDIVDRGGFSQWPLDSSRRSRNDPMPETQDEFYARTRPAMSSLRRGR